MRDWPQLKQLVVDKYMMNYQRELEETSYGKYSSETEIVGGVPTSKTHEVDSFIFRLICPCSLPLLIATVDSFSSLPMLYPPICRVIYVILPLTISKILSTTTASVHFIFISLSF